MNVYTSTVMKMENYSPRVKGSISARGNFFADFILL